MGCNLECYTKGRGCVISDSSRCAILYEDHEKPKIKSFSEAFEQIVRDNKIKGSTHKYKNNKNRKIAP